MFTELSSKTRCCKDLIPKTSWISNYNSSGTKAQSIMASINAPVGSWCHNNISKTTQKMDRFVFKDQTCKRVKPTFRILQLCQNKPLVSECTSKKISWFIVQGPSPSHTWTPSQAWHYHIHGAQKLKGGRCSTQLPGEDTWFLCSINPTTKAAIDGTSSVSTTVDSRDITWLH